MSLSPHLSNGSNNSINAIWLITRLNKITFFKSHYRLYVPRTVLGLIVSKQFPLVQSLSNLFSQSRNTLKYGSETKLLDCFLSKHNLFDCKEESWKLNTQVAATFFIISFLHHISSIFRIIYSETFFPTLYNFGCRNLY